MAKRFADTTAVFEWHAGRSQAKSEVRKLLGPAHDVVSSEAVEREWKRIVFDTSKAVLEAAQEETFDQFFAELSSGFGRVASQRMRTLSMLSGATAELNLTELKLRSSQMLRGDMDNRFKQVAASVRRKSQCGLATERPTAKGGEWQLKKTCKIRERICAHEARLDADAADWTTGAAALGESDEQKYKTMGETAARMSGKPRVRTGRNCYGSTGDLAIALDCRSDEEVVSTDKIFTVLGPAMGLTVHLVRP